MIGKLRKIREKIKEGMMAIIRFFFRMPILIFFYCLCFISWLKNDKSFKETIQNAKGKLYSTLKTSYKDNHGVIGR